MKNLGALLLIGLVVYSVIGIVRSEPGERLGVPRALWVLLVVLIPLVGSIVWIVVSTTHRAAQPRTTLSRGPSAPDDDDEFLWRLDEERRRTNPPTDEPKQ
ncbi:PLDc N-terminal domain-containing protein [Cellulomonas edaphi]|uniref:PLDc N-terminal domain-containing protein n=1 Tax=Cellulomonas edaphi TaxID=3053468 RepID=A0ABT7SBA9_9CELL|nr:PLDc N-terminal domain-containing protein [Cellulomons edaphi]MDM7832234.1 PLDc N-terminal domain-containing protein [Cellulomons edaphi]